MKVGRTSKAAVEDVYLDLVRRFPLRRLRNDQEQEEAVCILTGLVGRNHGRLASAEREYADALGFFIREYDHRAYPLLRRRRSPLELVKSLMEDHGMGSSDLGRILGGATAASLFLAGKRELSKAHIRRLSAYFRIDAGALL
jgi:antitoxin component HigA of HigAB toxin-antitoxin module